MCFIYDRTKGLHTTYLNGVEVYSVFKHIRVNMSGDYAFIGQYQYDYQSLSGEITQLNIWSEVISVDRIYSMANCQSNENGNYLSWSFGWELKNIEGYNIEYKKLCERQEDYYIYGFKNVYQKEAYYLCEALGSNIPMPESMKEIEKIVSVAAKKWPNATWSCKYDFFSPFTDIEEEGIWATYFNNKPFEGNIPFIATEPNGLHYENCAFFSQYGYADVDCNSETGCAICEFKEKVIYSLRGACQTEIRNNHFLSEQNELDHLVFRSYGKYRIAFNEGIWEWTDISKNLLVAKMVVTEHNYPMGRRNWTLFEEVCDQSTGTRELTLTSCKMDEFTCNDGKCISISNRCDLKYDCYDQSDEKNCEFIHFPIDYKRDLSPRGNSHVNNVLFITLKVSIESVSVDTELMEVRISFILNLLWNDNRLKFINLKESSSLNGVTRNTFEKLWLPFIGFMNTVGNAFSEADREAFMFVSKLVNKSNIDDSRSQETYLFSGDQNPIVINRRYMSTFYCKFDLVLYPFDEQSCGMEFQILNAPKDFLMFDKNNSMAENIDSSMLLEYEIGTLSVEHLENKGYSRVKVIVPLKRRAGFAILNIYIPSLCFVTITYMTLFFRTEIFDVRVMGSLTTLLVVATLLNQVSSFLPKTSYLKAVDFWLLFCTSLIFLIIVFHVLIDIVSYKLDEDERKKAWIVSFKRSPKIKETYTKTNKKLKVKLSVERLILISRITVSCIFILFNVIYWSIILI